MAFEALDKLANPNDVALWAEQEQRAQQNQNINPAAMDIYDIQIKTGLVAPISMGRMLTEPLQGPTKADMQLHLLREEERRRELQGSARLLSLGLVLKEAQ